MTTTMESSDAFMRAVKAAIASEIEEAVREAVKVAQAEVAKKIPEIVASVSLRVFQSVRYDRMGSELGIFVKIDGI